MRFEKFDWPLWQEMSHGRFPTPYFELVKNSNGEECLLAFVDGDQTDAKTALEQASTVSIVVNYHYSPRTGELVLRPDRLKLLHRPQFRLEDDGETCLTWINVTIDNELAWYAVKSRAQVLATEYRKYLKQYGAGLARQQLPSGIWATGRSSDNEKTEDRKGIERLLSSKW